MLLLLKLLPHFKTTEKRDNFFIILLSSALLLWLSWWLVLYAMASTLYATLTILTAATVLALWLTFGLLPRWTVSTNDTASVKTDSKKAPILQVKRERPQRRKTVPQRSIKVRRKAPVLEQVLEPA